MELCLLLEGAKTSQCYFWQFLFHSLEIAVDIEFTRKKKNVLNIFCTSQIAFVEKVWIEVSG